ANLCKDTLRPLNNLGPVPQGGGPASISAAQDVPRHRQHVAALIERATRGDERPALLPRLHDENRPGKAADDAIAEREELRLRRRPRHELADDRAALDLDVAGKRTVFGRITDVSARTKPTDRGPGRPQGPT